MTCHARRVDAGAFSPWLASMRAALLDEGTTDVPCDGCTACCRSSRFVHIDPDERATLARIPPTLLFPAPRSPAGTVLLGYDERGHCPMLVDDRCSIYDDRPRTCRTFDCRIYAAAGVEPDGEGEDDLRARVRAWRFRHPTAADRADHDAVLAAARTLADRPPTERAVRSVQEISTTVSIGPRPVRVGGEESAGSRTSERRSR